MKKIVLYIALALGLLLASCSSPCNCGLGENDAPKVENKA
jgi:hypothetical protein